MNIELPLKEMKTKEKIQAMEEIWNNLSQAESDIPSPDWHGEILVDRENQTNFTEWESAKQNIQYKISESKK